MEPIPRLLYALASSLELRCRGPGAQLFRPLPEGRRPEAVQAPFLEGLECGGEQYAQQAVLGQEATLKLKIGPKRAALSGVPKRRGGVPIEPVVFSGTLQELEERMRGTDVRRAHRHVPWAWSRSGANLAAGVEAGTFSRRDVTASDRPHRGQPLATALTPAPRFPLRSSSLGRKASSAGGVLARCLSRQANRPAQDHNFLLRD